MNCFVTLWCCGFDYYILFTQISATSVCPMWAIAGRVWTMLGGNGGLRWSWSCCLIHVTFI